MRGADAASDRCYGHRRSLAVISETRLRVEKPVERVFTLSPGRIVTAGNKSRTPPCSRRDDRFNSRQLSPADGHACARKNNNFEIEFESAIRARPVSQFLNARLSRKRGGALRAARKSWSERRIRAALPQTSGIDLPQLCRVRTKRVTRAECVCV